MKRRSLVPGILKKGQRSYLNRLSGPLVLRHRRPFKAKLARTYVNEGPGPRALGGKALRTGKTVRQIVRFKSIAPAPDATRSGMARHINRTKTTIGLAILRSTMALHLSSTGTRTFHGNQYVKIAAVGARMRSFAKLIRARR